MYIPFHQISDEARVWIYQANRPFTYKERMQVWPKIQQFLGGWAAHGHPLQCSADVLHDQFLVLAVEEAVQGVTGCSVDNSVQLMRELEQDLQITLLDRTLIAFKRNNHNFLVPLEGLEAKIQQGDILPDMLMFDNTVTIKGALRDLWLVPAKNTWLSKYFSR